MGKNVPAYRLALEEEICRRSGFARALRKSDGEAFDELIYTFRGYASETSNANKPIISEPMVMSIFLFQQKRLSKLEQELTVFEKTQQASSIDQANKKPQL